jgi:hypothetical protein
VCSCWDVVQFDSLVKSEDEKIEKVSKHHPGPSSQSGNIREKTEDLEYFLQILFLQHPAMIYDIPTSMLDKVSAFT